MDIKKYIYGHCVTPQRVKVWDEFSRSYIYRDLPCGKCLHCRNTRVNEWVTRLYAQSNYSKNVYYITLDYAPFSYVEKEYSCEAARFLAIETAAVWHNINKYHVFGMHPLLLKKNHLQDFFKRLRKNTGKKFQYFACGEYGTHAEGRGYGRPHFHIILFSNDSFEPSEIEDAWSLYGYKIGRVDFNDLRANGSFDQINNTNLSSKFVFKYVCKYLQKQDFDFEGLATIDFHRAYFEASRTLMSSQFEVLHVNSEEYNRLWREYKRDYAPFVVCSRRPSLGIDYFHENLQRFKEQDFRLFGLSSEAVAFPRYFLRKTKEALCRFDAVGKVSLLPSTSSRVGYVMSILAEIYNSRLDFANFGTINENNWCVGYSKKGIKGVRITPDDERIIPFSNLHLYDHKTRVFYQFNGYGYTLWHKVYRLGFVRCGELAIIDVLNKVQPEYLDYYNNFIVPMHHVRVLSEKDLRDSIDCLYDGEDAKEKREKFLNEVYARYRVELQNIYKKKLLMSNSKIEF